jgi:hypothetical protein
LCRCPSGRQRRTVSFASSAGSSEELNWGPGSTGTNNGGSDAGGGGNPLGRHGSNGNNAVGLYKLNSVYA